MESSDELVAHNSGALGTVPDVAVNKAYFIGGTEGSQSQILQEPDKQQSLFQASGALMPLYDPVGLAIIFENSSCLRSCVDAMVTNVDSFGQTFLPTIDLTQPNADSVIKNALRIERKIGKKRGDLEAIGKDDEPTDAEVKARRELLDVEIAEERAFLETFFDNCTVDMPFAGPEGLRGLTRADLEIQGNAYWEVIRDGLGNIAQFNRVPATSVRLCPLDDEPTDTQITERVSLLSTRKKTVRKRYRTFIQCWEANTKKVYFKEYGDPRAVSAKTGTAYKDFDALKAAEAMDGAEAVEATELFWFKISSQRTAYGAPRWIGTLLAVLGNRQSEEGNFIYFENRSVPPLAVLVSGGRLHGDSVAKLESHIQNNIKGSRNNHKILILEAERVDSQAIGAAASGAAAQARMKIEIVPLTDSQQKDALFQAYDERNADKIGQAFRLPRLLRGDVRDFNRSCHTASDTETLTENGWKLQEDIGPEEKIAAFDKDTGEVVFVVPTKKLVYDVVDEKMWHYHNNKTDFCVTAEHTTLSKPQAAGDSTPWTVGTAVDMPFDRFQVPVAASKWGGMERSEDFALPRVEACQIQRGHKHDKTVRFDDWLEFLGYFISEGGLLDTEHPASDYLVYIDQKKPEIRERMRACFDRLGWVYSTQIKPCGTTHFLFSNRCLRDWIVKNVGTNSYDKRLPEGYLGLSKRQLTILFRALMDGDGSWDWDQDCTNGTYHSVSKRLVDQVQELCLKLGHGAHARFVPGEHYTQADGIWRCSFGTGLTTTTLCPEGQDRTPPSLSIETYTGKVYCFSVPGYGFFVTRRNGKPAIQGNTAEASIDFAEVQVFGPIRQEFDWRINKRILADLGIKYHVFRSNAPAVRDPAALSLIIERLVKSNVLTPEEARTLSTGVFNHELPIIDSPWVKQPIALSLAGRQIEDNKATAGDEATRYHDDQVQPVRGKDGKKDSGAGANGFHYNSSGSGGTQEQLGVENGMGAGVEKGVKKDVFANEDDDGAAPDGFLDEEETPNRRRRLPNAARTLVKLHKRFVDQEREQAAAVWKGFERQIIKLPAEEFESLFVKKEE